MLELRVFEKLIVNNSVIIKYAIELYFDDCIRWENFLVAFTFHSWNSVLCNSYCLMLFEPSISENIGCKAFNYLFDLIVEKPFCVTILRTIKLHSEVIWYFDCVIWYFDCVMIICAVIRRGNDLRFTLTMNYKSWIVLIRKLQCVRSHQ